MHKILTFRQFYKVPTKRIFAIPFHGKQISKYKQAKFAKNQHATFVNTYILPSGIYLQLASTKKLLTYLSQNNFQRFGAHRFTEERVKRRRISRKGKGNEQNLQVQPRKF